MTTMHGSPTPRLHRAIATLVLATLVLVTLVLVTVAITTVVTVGAAPAAARGAVALPRWSHRLADGPWGLATDRLGAVVTGDLHHVESLDRSGHRRWRAQVDSLVEGSPAIDARSVVVGGRGRVTVLSRGNGKLHWQRPMGSDVTSVALARGIVLAGDHAGALVAFDARTGASRWSVQFDGRLWSAPRVDQERRVVVATWHWSATPAVRVFDLATGALRWQAPTGGFTAAPVVEQGIVVVAAGNRDADATVAAYDLATGAPRWSVPMPGAFEEAIEPAADSHEVVVVDHNGVVTMLDLASGTVEWRRATDAVTVESRVQLTAHRVVFTAFSGDLLVLDRRTGRVVSRRTWHQLRGFPIAFDANPWAGSASLLVALRDAQPCRIELLRLS